MDLDVVLDLLRAFAEERVRDCVVGAVALNLHGLARATAGLEDD